MASIKKDKKNLFTTELSKILDTFIKIIEYNELDVNRFLSLRETEKYNLYLTLKVLTYILLYVSYILQMFLFMLFYDIGTFWMIWLIFFFITSFFFTCKWYIAKKFVEKFDFTKSLFRKEKKNMVLYQKQLNLLLNNQFLKNLLGEDTYEEQLGTKIK